jgi:hypothetical protein
MREIINACKLIVHRLLVKKPLDRLGYRLQDNIKIYLNVIDCESIDWIKLAQERAQCRAFVDTVINHRVPYNETIYGLTEPLSAFSKITRLQGVISEYISKGSSPTIHEQLK